MKAKHLIYKFLFFSILLVQSATAQDQHELNSDWFCNPIKKTNADGYELSKASYSLKKWMPATVPGTVLTTLLNNGEIPDPFYGMNNEKIKDIYDTGRDYYTYWFVKDFNETAKNDEQVWLKFRGINYSVDIFLNGKKVNKEPFKGMYLRRQFNITKMLAKKGNNRLAILVHPADEVGNPNGGQGGDGTIAKGVALQYTAGWDWIQPVRDRNTGIWDKVFIEKTKSINLKNPHVVTIVEGKRTPDAAQEPVTIKVSAELENTQNKPIRGKLEYNLAGQTISKEVTLAANEVSEMSFPDFTLMNPKLWWPSGYGEQYLYDINIKFSVDGHISDSEKVIFAFPS